jgi:hypothetical protein
MSRLVSQPIYLNFLVIESLNVTIFSYYGNKALGFIFYFYYFSSVTAFLLEYYPEEIANMTIIDN